MKLYEIANDYLTLIDAIEAGDIPEECIGDTLEAVKATLEDKADNIACLLKSMDAEMKAIREEEVRLAERRKAKERACERLKEYLSDTLQRAGLTKVETPRNKITFRKSEKVEIVDEQAFFEWAVKNADQYLSYSAPTANKTAIKEALKSGSEIIGAELRINQNMQIK